MVTRTIKLNILSRQDLKDLENDVMRLEQLAQRKVTATQRISRRGTKGLSGTAFGGMQGAEALPSSVLKRREKAEIGRAAESALLAKQKKGKRSGEGPLSSFKEDKGLLKDVKDIKKDLLEAKSKISEFDDVISSPVNLVARLIGKNKTAAKGGAIFLLASVIAKIILERVKEFFGPGGPGDIRKRVLDVVRTIPELSFLLDVREGKAFLTSDPRVRSQVAQNSATQSLGNREILYTQLNIGNGLLD